jgi:sentrin-specific protease 1
VCVCVGGVDEAKAYSNQPSFDVSGWEDYVPDNILQQDNGSDCGVFTCTYAIYLSDRLDLTFSCADMPYFCRRLMTDLLANRAN